MKEATLFHISFAVNNQIYICAAKTFYQIATTHFEVREELGDCFGVLLQQLNTIYLGIELIHTNGNQSIINYFNLWVLLREANAVNFFVFII